MFFRNKVFVFAWLLILSSRPVRAQHDSLQGRAHLVRKSPEFFVQAGVMCNWIVQDKVRPRPAAGYTLGLSTKRMLSPHEFLLLEFNARRLAYDNMKTSLYDQSYLLNIELNTSFVQYELVTSLLWGLQNERFSAGIGAGLSWLIASRLQQNPLGYFGYLNGAIVEKYTKLHTTDPAPFYRTNMAPCLQAGWKSGKRLALSWTAAYELISNPIPHYSYFSPYNFILNSIVITFKLI